MRIIHLSLAFATIAAPLVAQTDPLGQALERLYNFDFVRAHGILDSYIASKPDDPRGPAFRAAALLFEELNRLGILESEFFADDTRIAETKKLKPDTKLRDSFYQAVAAAEQRAKTRLATNPNDRDSLFANCVTAGLVTDYMSLVEKRQFRSLSWARQSHRHAVRLLEVDPDFVDAYLTTGISEYLVGSLPFFVRWLARFDQVEGSKDQAVRNLERVASFGRYLGPFAKICLSLIHLREKRPSRTRQLLQELVQEFPANPLFRKELARLDGKFSKGELVDGGSR
jgi:hypothetical protein